MAINFEQHIVIIIVHCHEKLLKISERFIKTELERNFAETLYQEFVDYVKRHKKLI